ncbi:alpha-amylase family glycosyl hydrolase [Dysgonomonas sp. UBA7698]|uniref:alpha-amylase family glycosyl hydrolase n=1 Tax=Dysgonomonas sp. UBA7698 TaxID=1946427 RepID=UPI0025C3830C|nr:alpha-amylase family glycosyl hydrolase [Dysgonomonas sp. UBA7698]
MNLKNQKMNLINLKLSILLLFALLLFSFPTYAQKVERVEPLSWWVDMRQDLQLMLYGEDLKDGKVSVKPEGINIKKVHNADSPNYLFVDVKVGKPGKYTFTVTRGAKKIAFEYEIHERRKGASERRGFTTSDAIYLIMPDRFANGDTSNDVLKESQQILDRTKLEARHGGDIQGIIDHLDYIVDLGITTLWSTPLLEDNLYYHQYSCSDYYRIGPHFGTNELYRKMVEEAHTRGLKVIKDVTPNHCSIGHWWMKDLPFNDWINYLESKTRTNIALNSFSDPHASAIDREICEKGWFVESLPDMNLYNPFVMNYLAQAAIWWIEYANLDGLRVDTYFYMGKNAAHWTSRLRKEYPNMNMVGEIWGNDVPVVSYWLGGQKNHDGFDSNLPSAMDFPLQRSLIMGLATDNEGWGGSTKAIYNTLALDFLYNDPTNQLIVFTDNHDIERLYNMLGKDIEKVKLALTFICTTRGTPQITYGTELLFESDPRGGDHRMRPDFPGGWKEDAINLFDPKQRNAEQTDVFNHTRTLLNFRKNVPALHSGKLIHYFPEQNTYVYFRSNLQDTVMVIINASDKAYEVNWNRFTECLPNKIEGTDILTDQKIKTTEKLSVGSKKSMVIYFR